MLGLGAAQGAGMIVIGADDSRAIRIARVVCILSMTTVHFWPGASRVLAQAPPGWQDLTFHLVVNEFGRASVPLLSVISGVLLCGSLRRPKGLAELAESKMRALLFPLVIWSAIYISLLAARFALVGGEPAPYRGVLDWLNAFLALTAPPANEPLGFLRDIFVCAMLGGAAIRIDRVRAPVGQVLLALVAIFEFALGGVLMLRPTILLFFTAGLWIGLNLDRVPRTSWWIVAVLFAVYLGMRQSQLLPSAAVELCHRVAVAVLFWHLALTVARTGGPLARQALRLEPFILLIFCSHVVTGAIYGEALETFGIAPGQPRFILFWLLNLPIVVIGAILVDTILTTFAPSLLNAFGGKRRQRRNRAVAKPLGSP